MTAKNVPPTRRLATAALAPAVVVLALALGAGSAVAQETAPPAAEPVLPENPIPEVISPDPIAPGVPAPEPSPAEEAPGEARPNVEGAPAPATPDVTIPPSETTPPDPATGAPAGGDTAAGVGVMMIAEEDIQGLIRGQTYQGIDPATGEVVATVQYGLDGTSVLTLPDGTEEAGTYRVEGNTYCTRYEAFRDGTENCFTLQDLGDGRLQAWYTDGRRALILAPAT